MYNRMLAGVLFLLAGYSTQPAYAAETEATELRVGQRYEAGARVRIAMKGVSFIIPRGWSGGMAEGAETIRLASSTTPGIGLIYLLANIKPQDLAARLADSKELPGDVILQLAAPIKTTGSRSMAFYRQGELIGRALAISGPSENAVIYLFAGPSNQSVSYERVLEELAASTSFTKLKPEDLRKIWHTLLDGMTLTRLSSFSAGEAGGGSASSIWDLCPNGSFAYARSPRFEASDPSASGGERGYEKGTWRVELKGTDARLILTADNGTQTVYSLGYDGVKTYLDEAQVSRAPSKKCVEGVSR